MTGVAELGVIASVIQIADVGLKLSTKLYDFAGTVTSADKDIASISRDVKLTSTVLKDLGDTLERDKESRVVNENAVQTADGVVKECLEVFREMDEIFLKRTPLLRQADEADKATRGRKMMERLWWPYIKSKVLLLRSNLERLKSTLLLMLNVITYARLRTESLEPPSVIASQRKRIRRLNRSNQKYVRKFENMKKGTQKGVLAIETDARSDSPKSEEEVLTMETDTTHSSISEREASDIESDVESDAQSPSSASEKGAVDEATGAQSKIKDPQHASLDADTNKFEKLGLGSATDNLRTGKRDSLKRPLGEIPKEDNERDVQKPSGPRALQPGIVTQTSIPPLSIDSDMPAKPKSDDRVSGESSTQPLPFEANQNAKLEGDALLEHLKHYIVLINNLIRYIDMVPEALPLSSRQTVRDMLNRAYNVEIEQLTAQYGLPAVSSAAQELGPPFSGLHQRSSTENGTNDDQVIPIQSLPFYPSLPAENVEKKGKKLSPVSSEAGKDLPRSPAPPDLSETIRAEAAVNDQKREEPVIHRTSNASTVHDLLKSGWRFQARTKSSVGLLKRLEKLGSGMGIYVKPITHNGDVKILPSDHPTHYSIGINLPNIKEIFSPSFQSLDISSPKNPVRLSHADPDNSASTHCLPAAAAEAEAVAKAAFAARPSSPPKEPCKIIIFKDCVGRRFSFPFHLCSDWIGMEYLIKEAFLRVEDIGKYVADGCYDLLGPDGGIILKQAWASMIQPGWEITMHLWPIPEPPPEEDLAEEALAENMADIVTVEKRTPPPPSTLLDTCGSTRDAGKSYKKKTGKLPPFMVWTAGISKKGRGTKKKKVSVAKSLDDDLDYRHSSDGSMNDESRGTKKKKSSMAQSSDEDLDYRHTSDGSTKDGSRGDGTLRAEVLESDDVVEELRRDRKYKKSYDDEEEDGDEVEDLLALWTTLTPD